MANSSQFPPTPNKNNTQNPKFWSTAWHFCFAELIAEAPVKSSSNEPTRHLTTKGHFWLSFLLFVFLAIPYTTSYYISNRNLTRWLELIDSRITQVESKQDSESSTANPSPPSQGEFQASNVQNNREICDSLSGLQEADLGLAISKCKFIIDSQNRQISDQFSLMSQADTKIKELSENSEKLTSRLQLLETQRKASKETINGTTRAKRDNQNKLIELQLAFYKNQPDRIALLIKVGQIEASEVEKDRIVEQLQKIENERKMNGERSRFYYSHYYASIVTMIVTAAIGTICLFFIAKQGIDRIQNKAIVNVFLVCCSVFFCLNNLTNLLDLEKNYKFNRDLYIEYVNLKEQIDNYLVTNRTTIDRDTPSELSRIPANVFIASVAKRLQDLNKLYIDSNSESVARFLEDSNSSLKILNPPASE
jgi:hypothetical protein